MTKRATGEIQQAQIFVAVCGASNYTYAQASLGWYWFTYCRFHTRCPHATAQCAGEQPQLREVRLGHWAACHFAEQIYGVA